MERLDYNTEGIKMRYDGSGTSEIFEAMAKMISSLLSFASFRSLAPFAPWHSLDWMIPIVMASKAHCLSIISFFI